MQLSSIRTEYLEHPIDVLIPGPAEFAPGPRHRWFYTPDRDLALPKASKHIEKELVSFLAAHLEYHRVLCPAALDARWNHQQQRLHSYARPHGLKLKISRWDDTRLLLEVRGRLEAQVRQLVRPTRPSSMGPDYPPEVVSIKAYDGFVFPLVPRMEDLPWRRNSLPPRDLPVSQQLDAESTIRGTFGHLRAVIKGLQEREAAGLEHLAALVPLLGYPSPYTQQGRAHLIAAQLGCKVSCRRFDGYHLYLELLEEAGPAGNRASNSEFLSDRGITAKIEEDKLAELKERQAETSTWTKEERAALFEKPKVKEADVLAALGLPPSDV